MTSKILIAILITSVCFIYTLAEARNEYLNNGYRECRTGEVDVSVQQRDTDYNYSDGSTHEEEYLRLTFRKYLGHACTEEFKDLQMENMNLKQQLELFKMCNKVNRNPTLQLNQNFNLLVSKCKGIVPTTKEKDLERPKGNHWENLKKEYIKENPGNYMGTRKPLIMPTDEQLEGPLPEPKQ